MRCGLGTRFKPMLEGYKTVFDISPEITPEVAVFPGDVPFSRAVSLDFKKGDNLGLSAVTMSVHIGAHTDAPNHYHATGEGIESRSLHYYLGSCQVVSVKLRRGERVRVKDISHTKIECERVLFKTGSFPNPNKWNGDFNSLSAEVVEWLAQQKVILVGIDTPSIDLAEDKALESHQAVFANDMAVLEGIVLDQVSDGIYELIALPLRIKGADASPVRAVLCKK
jgi:arylformamidase